MRKTALSSAFLGTLIEVYDFTIFPFLIPILSEVFFSSDTKNEAINFVILAYVISYFIKPLGSIFFGCLIDRYGRKNILLFTTTLMTLATGAIALAPTELMSMHNGACLIVCRIIQGLAISGEFSAAIIMSVEEGGNKFAFTGSLAFLGGSIGLLLANFSAYILLYFLSRADIIQYAWRIPFIVGIFGCFILLLIRCKYDSKISEKAELLNLSKLIKNSKKPLGQVFIISSLSASAFYITFVFMPTYLSSLLHAHTLQNSILISLVVIGAYIIFLPLAGRVASSIGIIKQIKVASFLYLLFSYVTFEIIPSLTLGGCILVLVFFGDLPGFLVPKLHRKISPSC